MKPDNLKNLAAGLALLLAASGINANAANTWVVQPSGTSNALQAVTYGAGQFMAVGANDVVLTSRDGTNWNNYGISLSGSTLNGVAYGNNVFVVVDSSAGFVFALEPDGWELAYAAGVALNAICYSGGQFVTVGASGTVATSPAGTNWTTRTSGTTSNLVGVAYGNGLYIATAQYGGKVYVSPDGITWTAHTTGMNPAVPVNGIGFGNGLFEIAGSFSGYTSGIWYSSNGVSWAAAVGTGGYNLASPHFGAVTFGNGQFVAGGVSGDQIASSTDGTNWVQDTFEDPYSSSSEIFGMTYGNGIYVGVGIGEYAGLYSTGAVATAGQWIAASPPYANTQPATHVTLNSATLNGMASPHSSTGSAWFNWGTTELYGQTTSPVTRNNWNSVIGVSNNVTGLATNQIYHYSLVVSNALGIAYGADQQFITGGRLRVWGDNLYGQTNPIPPLGNVVGSAMGVDHSLALRTDGTLIGWGNNSLGQTNIPASATNVIAVSAGYSGCLALRGDLTMVAWGDNTFGQSNVPPTTSHIAEIASGNNHNLALTDLGTLIAWGANSVGETNIPPGTTNIVAIAAGAQHSVALRDNGTVTAWGYNNHGQTNVPPGLTNITTVAAGEFYSMALRNDGHIFAWGDNTDGQLNVPAAASNVLQIACGWNTAFALRADGTVVAWGLGTFNYTNYPTNLTSVANLSPGGIVDAALVPDRAPLSGLTGATGTINQDLPVTLAGGDADGDPVTFTITSLPTQGTLYQYAGGSRGAQITAADTVVSDSSARVIFVPVTNTFASTYSKFFYVDSDGELSGSGSATIHIPAPSAPQLTNGSSTWNATNGFSLTFSGLTNNSYTAWGSTDLVSWQKLGPATQTSPGAYSFTDPTATNTPDRYYRISIP